MSLLMGLSIGGMAFGQGPAKSEITRTVLAPVERMSVVTMREAKPDFEPVFKTVNKIHVPGMDWRKDQVRLLKEEATRVHDSLIAAGLQPSAAKTTTATAPTLGANFVGNSYGGGDPADNAMAISAGGKIISGSNTRWHTYDATGTQTSAMSFTQFATAGGVPTAFTFDPKAVYDPVEDRFIVGFLNGASSSSSKVIIAFSQTNDPAGAWNVYAVNGNVNSLGVWTDFIQMGLNTNDIFVTGNPFTNAGSSSGAAIWQINKADGYAGNPLNPVLHHVAGGFSIHPVQGGSTLYGPKMYFVQSDLGSSASVSLYEITNSAANNGVLNSAVGFTLDISYSVPPTADQRNTTVNLKTNDTRIQSSYFENNRIEFVLNSGVNSMSGIYHGTGVISPFLLQFSSFTGRQLGYTDLDIAYPSIAYAGTQDVSGFNHSYIGFNTSGPNNFPGVAAVYVDESGFSPKVQIKEGTSWINSADQRWGDYADMCERTGVPGEVWAVGTFGNSSQQQRTYIGQLTPPVPVAVTPPAPIEVKMDVFPNPATELVRFEFPVSEAGEYKVVVRDLQGRAIHTVVQDWLVPGTGLLSFNAAPLASGTYLVTVENASARLFSEKFVVKH